MPRRGTQSVTMYTTRDHQLADAFRVVCEHYGVDTHSQSGVLAELVRRKYEEIKDKKTRRDEIAGLRADVTNLALRMALLESLIDELITELKHDPTDYTDHA